MRNNSLTRLFLTFVYRLCIHKYCMYHEKSIQRKVSVLLEISIIMVILVSKMSIIQKHMYAFDIYVAYS